MKKYIRAAAKKIHTDQQTTAEVEAILSGVRTEALDEFFSALADIAKEKEIKANGPNPVGCQRTVSTIQLQMHEILKVRRTLEQ